MVDADSHKAGFTSACNSTQQPVQCAVVSSEVSTDAQDKLAENDARAADMQAHMDALRLSNAALQTRNDELVGPATDACKP